MKGKNEFTRSEIEQLKELIRQRIKADRSKQKGIRDKMRKIGFYGKDDFGITDLQLTDLDSLIKSGRIIVIDNANSTMIPKETKQLKPPKLTVVTHLHEGGQDYQRFDPLTESDEDIPNLPGNYLVCLRRGAKLPDTGVACKTKKFNGLNVIYTGIAGTSLRKRDYRQHFTGNNAGSSTLRKSLGSMFGYKKVPRDKKNPDNGKTKFGTADEARLSEWMLKNLVLFFSVTRQPELKEALLIDTYNPPLNLNKNYNPVNKEFRDKLSKLRSANID